MSWSDVDKQTGGMSEDICAIASNTTKLVHVLLPDNEEPVSYWTHFIPNKKAGGSKGKVVICPGRDTCPACANGTYRTSRKHAINVWDYEEKGVKILEQGNSVFQALKQIKEQIGTLTTVDISIKKMGKGLETTYSVIPIPPMTGKFDMNQVHGVFPIENLRMPNTPQEIQKAMDDMEGNTPPVHNNPTPISQSLPPTMMGSGTTGAQQSPPPQVTNSPVVLQFGKYKGKTIEQIYEEDPNYVKWCAENISDPAIKAESKAVIARPAVQKSAPTYIVEPTQKQILIQEIEYMFQNDIRYKGNFDVILTKMKKASISPTFPNGKTILSEYDVTELLQLSADIK